MEDGEGSAALGAEETGTVLEQRQAAVASFHAGGGAEEEANRLRGEAAQVSVTWPALSVKWILRWL